MKRTNGWGPKTLKISAKPPRVPGASQPAQSQPVQPPPIPGQPIDRDALIATIRSRIDERHNGLVNCGATCYLNSCLQMFSYVPELINETSKNQSLYSIFNDLYKLPLQNIDFLSIDIECNDIQILKSLDFSIYKIKTICVEHNFREGSDEIIGFMHKNGYDLVYREFSKNDYWFVLRV